MALIFVSYETPFAPCGGIAAVMGRLPEQMRLATGRAVLVMTPFHHRLDKTKSAACTEVSSFGVDFNGCNHTVHILRHDAAVPTYFLKVDDTRYFAGARHPYDMPAGDLLRDALLFGKIGATAVSLIAPAERSILMLQDWEAATVAIALADSPTGHRAFLTLHNSYDCGLPAAVLAQAGLSASGCPGHTVLQRALAVVQHEVFTVSEQFAVDLTEDVLQAQVMAPHLPALLKPRLVGVNNGPFADLAVEMTLVDKAAAGAPAELEAWKAKHRQQFLQALKAFKPQAGSPLWGDPTVFGEGGDTWFVMAGRDDPRQKGYDITAAAVTQFLEQGGAASFLFFPIPGDEGLKGLSFLERLAQRFPRQVAVFPFLFREGFNAALRGADFGIMPSLYEPFGMANEFYLNATVGIGRATGGIVQQIVPLRAAGCFSAAVARQSARWHTTGAEPTGLLFREPDHFPDARADWLGITSGASPTGGGSDAAADRVELRLRYPLYRALVFELSQALRDAIDVRKNGAQYFRMLASGVRFVRQTLSWRRAALDYFRPLRDPRETVPPGEPAGVEV